MPKPISLISTLCPYSQILFGRLPLTPCTTTQHQVRGCFFDSSFAQLEFPSPLQAAERWRQRRRRRAGRSWPGHGLQMHRGTQVRSPRWHRPPLGHLLLLQQVPVTHHIHLSARHSAPSRPADQHHRPILHLQPVISCPGLTPWDLRGASQRAVVVQNQFTYTVGLLVTWLVQNRTDAQNK